MYCRDMAKSSVSTAPHTESRGSGPALVVLHANGGDHRDFEAVAPSLAESSWRDTTLDWPGHGQSPRSQPETAIGFGAGHQPFIERPGEFLSRTAPFLAGLRTAADR